MGKKNKNKNGSILNGKFVKDLATMVTKARRKGGKLKVPHNKKLTKELLGECNHHFITKKGAYESDTCVRDGKRYCRMCDAEIEVRPYDDKEVKTMAKDFVKFLNHAVFVASEVPAKDSDRIIRDMVMAKSIISKIPGQYQNIKSIDLKSSKNGNKNKKKNKGDGGINTLSSWYPNR